MKIPKRIEEIMCEKCDDKGYIVFGPDTEMGREMALCDCQKKKKGGDDTRQGPGEKTPQKESIV